ncbi:MAG TPA: aminotransferase class V-fold PLP-dependent enzyme [Candidatus Limnocylindria bacterium]|nr:aminotransferase class V-fold PLP-dependent enzyme [Candidatus Limnocylindria bacterium]
MGSPLAAHWTLEPSVTFLNHGSYGAAPRPVLEAQAAWRERMEREPVRFFARDLEPALDAAREAVAAFVGADADGLAFVPNVTHAIATVLGSLEIRPDDELLVTDHAYNAARNALESAAARAGARVVVASVPFPIRGERAVEEAVLGCVSSRTRLALIDHVTSPTALRFPVERLVPALEERGVETLVDGAHAPGMVQLAVDALGATYYAGNLHKWVCAPKGAAFLWVRPARRETMRPLAISHGANSPRTDRARYRLEHDWTGTLDPTAWLAAPAAIEFGAALLPGGWPALHARLHDLALTARDLACDALGEPAPAPDRMLGSMAALIVPGSHPPDVARPSGLYADAMHRALLERHAIQVAVAPWPVRADRAPWHRLLRISAAPYNDAADMRRLADALRDPTVHPRR